MKTDNEKQLIECLAQMTMNYLEAQRDDPAEVGARTGSSDDGQFPTGRYFQHDSTGAVQMQAGANQ